jgi:hypothetical protein
MGLTKRVQVLMEPEQYKKLVLVAGFRGTSVGDLLRQAAQQVYLARPDHSHSIVDGIAGMDLPVDDWEQLKEELEEAHDDLPT